MTPPLFSLKWFPSVGTNSEITYLLFSISIIEGFAKDVDFFGVEIKTSV
jgi:hypothetical protein